MTDPLRIGIAGNGVMGRRRRALIDAHPRLTVVGVEDTEYIKLLDQPLDALCVCLPNYLAARATIAGLERGFHVFCEKPPGRDLDDIAAVMRTEAAHPELKLMYGFNHRYHGSIRKARELVSSGILGNVVSMRGVYAKAGMQGWRTRRRESGGGILLDQGVHMLDLFLMLGGDFNKTQSRIRSHGGHDVEDDAWALLENDDGVVATIHSTATATHHRFELDITLDKGEIALSGILSGSMRYAPERILVRGAMEFEDTYTDDTSFAQEISAFAQAVIDNQTIDTGTSAQAYAAMALVYRIYCADPTWQNRYNLTAQPRERMS